MLLPPDWLRFLRFCSAEIEAVVVGAPIDRDDEIGLFAGALAEITV